MSPYLILIASVTFLITIGVLNMDINHPIDSSTTSYSYLATPSLIIRHAQKTRTNPLPERSPTPSPTQVLYASSTPISSEAQDKAPILEPTLSPTIIVSPFFSALLQISPTPIPTITHTSTDSIQHIYYTSSHWKAKYYYCDTDKDWQTLSETYRKSFSSVSLLLAQYPTKIPHEPCKP